MFPIHVPFMSKKKIGKILRATVVPVAWSLMRVPGCRGGNVGATLLALFQHQYPDWLVVSTPLKNMKVSWDDDIPNINIKFMLQTTNQLSHL